MAEKWKGFTEEDIRNITKIEPALSDLKILSVSVNKRVSRQSRHYIRKNMAREQILHGLQTTDIPKEARLSIPQIPEEEEEAEEKTVSGGDCEENKQSLVWNDKDNKIGPSLVGSTDIKACSNSSEFLRKPILSPDADQDTLLEFQARQKLMEEQNRQRKELLKKALEDRTKKTHAEAQRLNQIEEELKKLDMQLSCDVAILRNQIELASLDFMEAQKRFNRAEREYLDAKLSLFNKKEHKELLTSHLCTIIEQNELRKSKKLSSLMEMLEIGNIENKHEGSTESNQK